SLNMHGNKLSERLPASLAVDAKVRLDLIWPE
ncbi:hypothetical protein Tco_1308819, partial [Tanacetum coccineum]